MNADLHCRLRHAGQTCCLGYRKALYFHVNNRQPLAFGQGFKQTGQVAPGVAGFRGRLGEYRQVVVQRIMQILADGLGPQQIDHLVTRDRMHPSRQRLVALVRVALIVHGEQAFLDKVFHFIGPAEEAFAQKSAQIGTELLEEGSVGGGISIEAAHEQVMQHLFRIAFHHNIPNAPSCHSIFRLVWL